jgi:hypothetical protein
MFVNSNQSGNYGSSSLDEENSNSDYSSNSNSNSTIVRTYNEISNDENQNQRQNNNSQHNQYSILSSPSEEECQFELLNPIEKFFKLCETPSPQNM